MHIKFTGRSAPRRVRTFTEKDHTSVARGSVRSHITSNPITSPNTYPALHHVDQLAITEVTVAPVRSGVGSGQLKALNDYHMEESQHAFHVSEMSVYRLLLVQNMKFVSKKYVVDYISFLLDDMASSIWIHVCSL